MLEANQSVFFTLTGVGAKTGLDIREQLISMREYFDKRTFWIQTDHAARVGFPICPRLTSKIEMPADGAHPDANNLEITTRIGEQVQGTRKYLYGPLYSAESSNPVLTGTLVRCLP